MKKNNCMVLQKAGLKVSTKSSLLNIFKLFNRFLKLKKQSLDHIKIYIEQCCGLELNMTDDFYQIFLKRLNSNNSVGLFKLLLANDIYGLISYLKYQNEDASRYEEFLTPEQYYNVPKKHINHLVNVLKKLKIQDSSPIDLSLSNELIWRLKREPNSFDYDIIAYKMYLSIGLDNSLELLNGKYGIVDYEKIYFLFFDMDVKNINEQEVDIFKAFLFSNKKSFDSTIKQMLDGECNLIFLNFAYLFNNISYFVRRLGNKLQKSKVLTLLEERYLPKNVALPEMKGDVLDDMISSYFHRYDIEEISDQEIYNKYFSLYEQFIKYKYKSSIPGIELTSYKGFRLELLKLNDPRNLVLGYRAGNCFRLNGDASILFRQFLKSEHMRLLSISTDEYKDMAMCLIMRNGNVLIGQGIEVSKRIPDVLKGYDLYIACTKALNELMDYMNNNGDEIVSTIIGSTNSNVSLYNNQILPFLVGPILDSPSNFYNGIYNYQCLLKIKNGKSLSDINPFIPSIRYEDEREEILFRKRHQYDSKMTYMDIEKRLIALRYKRFEQKHDFSFYHDLVNRREIYTICNTDWYITLFDDGSIDSFILEDDERAKEEYETALSKLPIKRKSKIYCLFSAK